MADEHGGFEGVRENLDGNPMWRLFGYATPYWLRLTVGVLASFLTRFARLVPPIIVAAAIDRVVLNNGEPGLLTQAGVLPPGETRARPRRSRFSSDWSSSPRWPTSFGRSPASPLAISSSPRRRKSSATSGTTPTTTCNTSRWTSSPTTRPAG